MMPDAMSDAALHVFWHDDCLAHDTGAGLFDSGPSALLAVPETHPENAARLRNMRSALERGPLARDVHVREGRHATEAQLAAFHDPAYIKRVRDLVPDAGVVGAGGHTFVSPGTWAAALAAAGSAIAAADAVVDGDAPLALALVRPPGHHAGPATTDGYCFLNNAALAACRLRERGAQRVAILDWDVHHGNGTQAGFYDREDVLTISLHMDHRSWGPTHPEDGLPTEIGAGAGEGYNVNVALPYGVGDRGYLAVIERVVAPILARYRPDAIVCAVGQDASQNDPNGRQCVSMDGFHRLGRAVRALAGEHTGGRIVMTQDGGYEATYSAVCLSATLGGMLGRPLGVEDPLAYLPDEETVHLAAIAATRAALAPFWF